MKRYAILLALLPFFAAAQKPYYFSADASLNFGKFLEHTGYGLTVSANRETFHKLYVGIATGAVQVKPFIRNPAIPLNARITFFTSNNEEKIAPFGLFEGGKLFYNEKAFNGNGGQTMKGKWDFFAGVGMKLTSHRNTHLFFALGYAGFNYANRVTTGTASYYDVPYSYRRMALRAGLTLPH